MLYSEILDIIKTGEGQSIELKQSLTSSIGKEICAFANSTGGKIIIGVEDSTNQIKGYDLKNSDKSKIQDIARNMNPSFKINIEQIDNLVIISIPEGKEKPYTINGHFYLRQGANSQQLNRDEIRDFFRQENLISFEKQITSEFKEKDFSKRVFEVFRKQANLNENLSKTHILENLKLLTDNKLNNAGILFFSNNITHYFPTAEISCFLYADTEKIDIIDSKFFTNNFISNLENAQNYIISKLNTAIIIKDELRHKTKLELPKEALREAIINAMIHKDYFQNSPVQINICPDRVEIVNPGRLAFPEGELGKKSFRRNPILVDLIHRLGFVEKAGSGINRIKDLANIDNIKIDFKTGMFFDVVFHRKSYLHKKSPDVDANPAQIGHKSDGNRTRFKHKSNEKIRCEWILKYLEKNQMVKSRDIIHNFRIVKDTASRDINNLLKQGKIIKKGGGSNVWYELNE